MRVNPKRLEQARLDADMSRGDLAHALRRVTSNRLRATDGGIAGWEKGKHAPSDGVVPAYAIVTGKSLEFFYESDGESSDDEDSSAGLTRATAERLGYSVAAAMAEING